MKLLQMFRGAAAGGSGRCPGPDRPSSQRQSPAGKSRGRASCLQSRCGEPRLHEAPTRSQHGPYPGGGALTFYHYDLCSTAGRLQTALNLKPSYELYGSAP